MKVAWHAVHKRVNKIGYAGDDAADAIALPKPTPITAFFGAGRGAAPTKRPRGGGAATAAVEMGGAESKPGAAADAAPAAAKKPKLALSPEPAPSVSRAQVAAAQGTRDIKSFFAPKPKPPKKPE